MCCQSVTGERAFLVSTKKLQEKESRAMAVDATQPYDDQNIFAMILRGEIPCRKVYEDEFALAFYDINPQAPAHILIITKGTYISWDDFYAEVTDTEVAGFVCAVGTVARDAVRSGENTAELHSLIGCSIAVLRLKQI